MGQIETNSYQLHSRSEVQLLRGANKRISSHLDWLSGVVKAKSVSIAGGPVTLAREEVTALLEETAATIFSIGHLHHRLAENSSQLDVDLSNYVINACSDLISSLALQSRVIIVDRTTPNCLVSSEQAQVIGVMMSEIVMNAVKYAHPTGIAVQFTIECRNHRDGRLLLVVGDDGVGLPEGMDSISEGGTGLKLIRSLANSLDADLCIESDPLGLSFVIEFPSQAQTARRIHASGENVRNFPK
jgi:two-component sensor histidine kinase